MPKDAIAAVLATNLTEALEYLHLYVSLEMIALITVVVLLLLLTIYFTRRVKISFPPFSKGVVFVMLTISVSLSIYRPLMAFASNCFYLFTKEYPVLSEYKQNPLLVYKNESPQNIVLIMGESFSKYNSSLYEYEKETNPLLGKMASDRTLFVYGDVESYSTSTIPSIKSIMSSYTDDMSDSISWFQCLTLLEVIQKCGYETLWLSNQSKNGFWDNEIGAYSDMCDRQFFFGEKYIFAAERENTKNLDENLINVLDSFMIESAGKRMYILHLMGSHMAFNMRYPESYEIFDSEDYDIVHPDFSIENKQLLAEYDNSICYNDFVVNELISRFADSDAIVFYLSDHGIDVFKSSDDYIGHAKTNDAISVGAAKKIPFMVYTSPLFREKHPELQQRIEGAVSRPYRTDSIMYTIMDIAGVETVNGVSYKHKSLFK